MQFRYTETVHGCLLRNVADLASEDGPGIPVLCAWPVSGQYVLGSRILFHLLIATRLIAWDSPRIKNASLVGISLFPAVAALHATTSAALHNPSKPC